MEGIRSRESKRPGSVGVMALGDWWIWLSGIRPWVGAAGHWWVKNYGVTMYWQGANSESKGRKTRGTDQQALKKPGLEGGRIAGGFTICEL